MNYSHNQVQAEVAHVLHYQYPNVQEAPAVFKIILVENLKIVVHLAAQQEKAQGAIQVVANAYKMLYSHTFSCKHQTIHFNGEQR